jgi:hypothetical protein
LGENELQTLAKRLSIAGSQTHLSVIPERVISQRHLQCPPGPLQGLIHHCGEARAVLLPAKFQEIVNAVQGIDAADREYIFDQSFQNKLG